MGARVDNKLFSHEQKVNMSSKNYTENSTFIDTTYKPPNRKIPMTDLSTEAKPVMKGKF